MQEFDLYGDLELQHAEQKQKATEDLKWKDKYEVALSTIEKLQAEKKELNKKIKHLETNFASLFETARTEIKRKDNQICELRKQKDDICFRRTKPQFAGRQFNENAIVHRPVSSERVHKNPFSGEPRKIISPNTVHSEQFSDDKIPSSLEDGKHNVDKANNKEPAPRNASHENDSIRDRHRNRSKDRKEKSRNRNRSRDRVDERNRSRDRVDERNRSPDRKDERDRSRDPVSERDRSRDRIDDRSRQRFDDRYDTKHRDRLEYHKSKQNKERSSHKEDRKHDKKRKRYARDKSETRSSDSSWDKNRTDKIDDWHSQRMNYTNNEEKNKTSSSRHEQTKLEEKPRHLCNKSSSDHTKAQTNDSKIELHQLKNVPCLENETQPKIEILQIEILKDVKELKKNKLKAEKMPKPEPIDPAKVAIEKSNQLLDALFDDSIMNKSEDPIDDGLLYDNLLVSTQPADTLSVANKKQKLIRKDENSNLNFQTPQRQTDTKLLDDLLGTSPADSLCSVAGKTTDTIPDANIKQNLIKNDENSSLNFQTPQRQFDLKMFDDLFGASPAGSLCSVVGKRNSVISVGGSSSDSDFIPISKAVRIEKDETFKSAIIPNMLIVEQIVIDDSCSENDKKIEKECFEMKPPKNPVKVVANPAGKNEIEILDDDLLVPFKQIDSNSENKKLSSKTDENSNFKQQQTTPLKQLDNKLMYDLFGASPGGSICGQKLSSPSMDDSSSDFYFEPNKKPVNRLLDDKPPPNMPIIIDDNYTENVISTNNKINHEVKESKHTVAAPSSTEKTVTANVKQLLGFDSSFYSSEEDEINENLKEEFNTAGQDIQSPAFEEITPRKHVEMVETDKSNILIEKSDGKEPNSVVQSTNKGNSFQNTSKTTLLENQHQYIIINHFLERNIERKESREKDDVKKPRYSSKSTLEEYPNHSSSSRRSKKEKHHHHDHHHHHHHKHKHHSKESTHTKSECSSRKYSKNNRNLKTSREQIETKDLYSKDESDSTSFKNHISKARSSPMLVYYDDDPVKEPPQNQKISEQDQVFFLHCDDISSDDDEIIGGNLYSDECSKKESNHDNERHIEKIDENGIMGEQILVDIEKPNENNKTEIHKKSEESKIPNDMKTNKRDMSLLTSMEEPIISIIPSKDENSEKIDKKTECKEPNDNDLLFASNSKTDENSCSSMVNFVNIEEIDNKTICDVKLDKNKTKTSTNIDISGYSPDVHYHHLRKYIKTSEKENDFIEIKSTENVQTETDESKEREKSENQKSYKNDQILQETFNTHARVEVVEKNHIVPSQEVDFKDIRIDKNDEFPNSSQHVDFNKTTNSPNIEHLSNDPNNSVPNDDNTDKIVPSNCIDETSLNNIDGRISVEEISSIENPISKETCVDEHVIPKNVSDCELVIPQPVKLVKNCDELPVQQPTSSVKIHEQTNYHEVTSQNLDKPFDIPVNKTLVNSITNKDEEKSIQMTENISICSKNEPVPVTSSVTDENISNSIIHSSHVSPQKLLNSTDEFESPQSNSESVSSGRRKKTKTPRKRSDMCKGDSNKTMQMVSDRYTKCDEVNTSASIQSESNLISSEVSSELFSPEKVLRDEKLYCTQPEVSLKSAASNFIENNTIVLETENEPVEIQLEPKENKKITEGPNESLENEKEILGDKFPQVFLVEQNTKDENKTDCFSKEELTENNNISSLISGDFSQQHEKQNETIEESALSSPKSQENPPSFPSETVFNKDQQNTNSLIIEDCLKTCSPKNTRSEGQVKNTNVSSSELENSEMSKEPAPKAISSEENHLPISEIKTNKKDEENEKSVESFSITIKRHRNKRKNIKPSTEVIENILNEVEDTKKILYPVESSLEDQTHNLSIEENQKKDYLEKTNNEDFIDKNCSSSFNNTKTSISPALISSTNIKQKKQQHPIEEHQMMKHFMDSEHSLVGTCNYPMVIDDDTNVKNETRNNSSSLDNLDKTNEISPICESEKVQVKRKYTKKTKKLDVTKINEDVKDLNDDHATKKPLTCELDKLHVKRKYTKRTKNLLDNSNNSEDGEVANSSISEESKTSLVDDDDNTKNYTLCGATNKVHVKRKYTKKSTKLLDCSINNEDVAKVNNNSIIEELKTVLNDDDDNNKQQPTSETAKVPVKRKCTKKTQKLFDSSNSNEDIEVSSNSNISDESIKKSLNDDDDQNNTILKATEHFKSPDDLKQPTKKRKYTRKSSNSSSKSRNKSNESSGSLDDHEIQPLSSQFESVSSSDKSNSSQSIAESVEILHSSNETIDLGLEKCSKSENSNISLGPTNKIIELCENLEIHESFESDSSKFFENPIESHDIPSSSSYLESANSSEKIVHKLHSSERTGNSELCLDKSSKLVNFKSEEEEDDIKVSNNSLDSTTINKVQSPQPTGESVDTIHHTAKEATEIPFDKPSNNCPDKPFEEFCDKNTNVHNAIDGCLDNSLSGDEKEHDLNYVKHKKKKKHRKRKLSISSDSKLKEANIEAKRSKNTLEDTSQSSITACDTTSSAASLKIHHEPLKESHRSPSHEKSIFIELTPTHHKIFLNDGFSNDPPPIYNANDDDLQYHEIDDRMRSMFQSPTYTQSSNGECTFDKKNNDNNEHSVVDETLNESERTQCDTSISSRKVCLGSNEYVIESTGSHTANVFITRKKSKKRTKVVATSV